MKRLNLAIVFCLYILSAQAQEKVKLSIQGVTPEAALKMKLNGDRISWYSLTSNRIASNLYVEISNTAEKRTDRGSAGVQANPDAQGMYSFSADVEIELKKTDKTKPLHVEMVVQTVFGNELFYIADMSFEELSKPIVLNGYMWRATNEKIQPKKDLCLEFSSFVENADLRKLVSENENYYKFNTNDFSLELKQDEQGAWKSFTGPFQGGFANNNEVTLSNPMPSWIDPAKKLFVRFAAKTPLNNYVWAEYAVEPHEYRREQRALYYTSVAYDVNSKPNLKDAPPAAPQTSGSTSVEKDKEVKEATPVKSTSSQPPKTNGIEANQVKQPAEVKPTETKSKAGGLKMANTYEVLIKEADSLFTRSMFQEAKSKFDEAAKLKPTEEYPKKKAEECEMKIKAIESKKSKIGVK
jgi:hypothetical protein